MFVLPPHVFGKDRTHEQVHLACVRTIRAMGVALVAASGPSMQTSAPETVSFLAADGYTLEVDFYTFSNPTGAYR
ncbi:MAG TPA: hypothetical protein VM581_00430 [Magnetospirillaceae bacterium]|nr:hypothetical protein [Magnetospirillaceae bacterium]